MNAKQLATIQTITSNKWVEWKTSKHIDGTLAFSVSQIGDSVMVHAFNTQSIEWFQKAFSATMLVGVRGGIKNLHIHIF